ncbi:MAG: hypothetical protein QOE70_3621 [Chthoniobacter sp.]|jgi:uncharacterized repeat protein (TIGR01451 family)|nr:hypothetical protein [Chthoniobacter sp.]
MSTRTQARTGFFARFRNSWTRPSPGPLDSRRSACVEPLEGRIAPATVLTATLTDNTAGSVNPGGTINYTEVIQHGGTSTADAVNVSIANAITNGNLVAGSLNVSPLAGDDVFSAIGNTTLIVNASGTNPLATPAKAIVGNLFTNDMEFENDLGAQDTFTLASFTQPAQAGGSVTVNSDGTFTYLPKAGFTGTDTFTYTITDDGVTGLGAANSAALTSTGTVTITVANEVWYVDNSGANGDGRSSSPFNSLASVTGAAGLDVAGDIIYVRTGSSPGTPYTGGITLLNNQTLWGENEALVVGGFTLKTAGTDPVITNAAGNGVTVANGATLKGFTVGDTSGFDISNTTTVAAGTVNISNVVLNGTGGLLNFDATTTLNATLDSMNTTSAATGINLVNVGGSLGLIAGGNVTMSGVTGTAVNVNGGAINIDLHTLTLSTITSGGVLLTSHTGSFDAVASFATVGGNDVSVVNGSGNVTISGTINNTAGRAVNIDNHDSGNVTISANITGSGGTGINVVNNGGGIILFSGTTKTLNTGTSDAVTLTNNGGAAINFTNGGLDIDTTSGIGFNATGGGTITVTGSGNSINNTGAVATHTNTALNVANTTIGAGGLNFVSITSGGGASGIILNSTGTSGGLTVSGDGGGSNNGSGGTIQNTTGDGISLTTTENVRLGYMNITNNLGDGIGGSGINGFVLTRLNITGNGNDAATDESGINIANLTGSSSVGTRPTAIVNSVISNNNEFEVQITNTSGTLTNFQLTTNTISSNGLPINGNGSSPHGNLVNFLGHGTAIMGLTVNGGSFTGNWNAASPPATITATGVHADTDASAAGIELTVNVTGATFTNNNAGVNVSSGNANTDIVFDIENNTFIGQRSTAINIFGNGNSPFVRTMNGTIQGNTIGTNGVVGSGSLVGPGISIGNESAANMTLLINNNILQSFGSGPGLGTTAITVDLGLGGQATGGGTTNITITNNTIRDVLNGRAITIQDNQDPAFGPFPTIFANVAGNTFAGTIAGQAGNGQFMRIKQLSGTVKVTQGTPTAANTATELDNANGQTDPTKFSISGTPTFSAGTPPLPTTNPLPLLFAPSPDEVIIPTPVIVDDGGTTVQSPVIVQPPVVSPPVIIDDGILSQAELDSLVGAAIARWEATGLTPAQDALLHNVQFAVEDMPGWYLGKAEPGHVVLDRDAAGHAWFIDPTPNDDSEFAGTAATANGGAQGRLDALTTVMHELGHQIGLGDTYAATDSANLMYGFLHQSERRLPAAHQADGAVPGSNLNDAPDFLFSPIDHGRLNNATTGGTTSITLPYTPLAPKTLTVNFAATAPAAPVAAGIDNVSAQGTISFTGGTVTTVDPGPPVVNGATVTPLNAAPDLQMASVSDGATTVNPGGSLAYTLTYNNHGNQNATGVVLTETLPTGTTFNAAGSSVGWTETFAGSGVFKLTVGALTANAANATKTFAVTVNTPAPAGLETLTNTASITDDLANGTDPTNDNSATDNNTALNASPDLSILKSDGGVTIGPGGTVTYALTYQNIGNQNAATVKLHETVPTGTTFNAGASDAGWVLVTAGAGGAGSAGSTYDLTIASLTGGAASASKNFAVTAGNPFTGGAQISNTATIDYAVAEDSNPANNTSTDTTVVSSNDLSITKTDNVPSAIPGTQVTYVIVVSNSSLSGSAATGATVADAFPATLTNLTLTGIGTSNGATSSKSAGAFTAPFNDTVNLPINSTITYTITGTIAPSATTSLSNTATVTAPGGFNDVNSANNTATDTDTLTPQANLAVTKSDSPDPVTAGGNVTYTLNFSNNGASDAQSVTLTDAVPANTTFVSAVVTTGSGWTVTNPSVGGTGNVVFSKSTVGASETGVFTIVAKVNASTANGATITNSATTATTTTDPDNSNNTATATTTVQTRADLAVTKTDSPDPVIAGQNVTYTVNLANNGSSDAQTVTLTDAVPAGTTFVSAVVTTGSGWAVAAPAVGGTGNIVFSKSTVTASETGVFTIVAKVNASTASGSTITNSAVAATATTDPTPGNNTGTATTTVSTQADLAVTKNDSPDPVIAGNNVTYTVNLANNGASDAQTVTLTDAVPAGTTFVSAVVTTGSGWTLSAPAVGGTGNVVFSKSTVGASETGVFTIVAKVNANAANGATITNSATAATTTTDPTPGNNTGTATTTVQTQADLAVTKTDTPDPAFSGGNITYTVNLTNNGASDAQSVTLTDAIPTNTTFVSAVVTSGSGWTVTNPAVGGTGNVVFSKSTVGASETGVFTIVAKVNGATPNGATIVNNATAASTTTDPTPGNNTGTATTTVQAAADLAVTKTDSPDPATAGNNVTYTVNLANNGPGTANTVTLTDAVPAGTTFVSAVVTTGSGWSVTAPAIGGTGNVVFSKSTVAAAETGVFTIVARVNPNAANGATITNSAVAASTTGDPDSSNNTGTATTTVQTRADLAVTKSDTPDPVIAGGNVTYTVNLSNNGASDAQSVTLTDAVPPNTTFVSAVVTTGSGWSVTAPAVGGTGNVVFSKSTVGASETGVFTIVAKVNSSVTSGATITNSATAASATADPTPGNNTGTATTTVNVQADLAVTKTDSPDPVTAGNNVTYTVNLSNNGASDAQTVTLTDAVPAGTTFVSAVVSIGSGWTVSAPAVGGTGNIVFSKSTVTAAETGVFTIVAKVPASAATGLVITNSAVAASTTTDPNSGNNTGTATTTVQTRADLAVTKSDSPDPIIAGNNVTYTVNLANNGASNAQSVTLTDAVPAGTTFVSAVVTTGSGWTVTAPAVGGTGNVVFSKGTVDASETGVFTIVANVNPSAASGSTITNSATAASTTTDPDNSNNTGTATTTVQTQADLAVTKNDSPDPVIAGNNVTYTINLANNGVSNAQSVTLTDAVPAGTTFVSAAVTTGSGWTITAPAVGGTGNVVFSKSTVGATETGVFTIVAKVNSSAASGSTIINSATAASTTTDPTPGNNTGTATTTVNTQADLVVTKNDSPDPVIAGNNVTYTINLANNGASDAQTVTLTDAVPAGTTFVSAVVTTGSGWTVTAPAVGGTGSVVFSKSTVGASETGVFTIVAKVNSSAANGLVIDNTATATSATADPTPGNNSSTAVTTVQTQADLAVTKNDSPDPVIAGNDVTYTINLGNAGASDAQSVTLTDAVPAGTTFVSAVVTTGTGWTVTAPAVGGTGNIVFSKSTVAAAETGVFTIVAKVPANANTSTITNSATAGSATTDPTPGNNTGTATTTVQTQADLAVTKTDSPDPVIAGANVTYTINLANNGASDAQTVTLTDAVPAGTTFVSAAVTTGSGWTMTAPAAGGTGNVVFSKSTVAASETGVFTIVAHVNSSAADGSTIDNTATAASATTDPAPGNNSATAMTTVHRQSDLAITKIGTPALVVHGGQVTYTITVTNAGASDVTGAMVDDTFPTTLNNVTWTAAYAGGATGSPAGVGDIHQLVNVPVPGSVTYTVKGTVAANALGAKISNTATVASAFDNNATNNLATADTKLYQGIYVISQGIAKPKRFGPPEILVFDVNSATPTVPAYSFVAYEPEYRDSVRVAVGDLTGPNGVPDGFDDIITTTGMGTGRLRVFAFNPTNMHYEQPTTGVWAGEKAVFDGVHDKGAFVAAGDLNGDGRDDVTVGSALGGNKVKVLDGKTGAPVILTSTGADFFQPFGPAFKGGVRVAVGDINDDNNDDLITGMGLKGAEVKVYGGKESLTLIDGTVLKDFTIKNGTKTYKGGVSVGAGDVNNDGKADIIIGRNTGKPSQVEIFAGDNTANLIPVALGNPILPFDANPAKPKYTFGVRVAAVDVNFDGIADIIAGVGGKGGSQVKFFDGVTHAAITSRNLIAYTDFLESALFVAGSSPVPVVPSMH